MITEGLPAALQLISLFFHQKITALSFHAAITFSSHHIVVT
jgi:hypothetical protein